MRHIYLWNGSAYGGDIINRLQSGHIQYSRPFGLGYTEATLVFQASSEAAAYAEFPKGLKVKIIDDSLTGSRYDGTTLLVGYVDRTAWNESTKTVRITLKDYLYLSLDRKVGPVGFISKQVSDMIAWVASQAGVSVLYRPASRYEPTIPYHFFEEETVQSILSTIAMDLGGKMYCSVSEPHVLVVEYGCLYSSYSPTALTSIDLNDVEDFDIDMPARQPNVFECEGKNKSLKSGIVFESANYENPWTIPAGGIGVTNDHFIEFDRAVVYIDEMVFDADAGITFDETVWASNFVDNDISKPLKNPYKAKIKITASTEGDVWKFRLKGRAVHEDKQVVTKDNSGSGIKRNWKHTSDMLYDSSAVTWLSRRVTWEAAKKGDSFSFAIISGKYPFFGPHTSVSPDYIINVSGAYVAITDMTLELGSGKLNVQGIGDRSGYDPTLTDDYGDITVPTIPVLPEFGDGVAPATPTWAGTPLTTFFTDGKTYIQVDWEANSENDIKGYEVAWSYDNVNWYNSGLTSETSLVIEVKAGVTVYAKVRAKDIEGFESSWTASRSITSAKDTTIPSDLSSITAIGGFDLIYVYWVHTKPSDFSHYIVQRAPSPYTVWTEVAVVQSKEFIDKNVTAGTYYKYRVKAVDIYGNEAASWITTSSGVTCSSIASELAELEGELTTLDGELTGLAGELTTLESELDNLQFADIGGTITEVQIGNDTISAPKLKANSVESAKIAAGAVVAEKIYAGAVTTAKLSAGAVTAEKIYAGAVTTDKLYAGAVVASKIAANAIEANHISAGAITANKLEATLDLLVGRQIRVGSGIQIGAGVGPVGSTFDGIYVSDGTNYVKLSASMLEMKADLILGAGDNAIHFEDGLIDMVDDGYGSNRGSVSLQWVPTGDNFVTVRHGTSSEVSLTYTEFKSYFFEEGERVGYSYFQIENRASSSGEDHIRVLWEAGVTAKNWYYYDSGDFDISGFVKFQEYIKFDIPTWYGTKTSATNKYPDWDDWTDAENCPNSNIWIWLKSSGTPAYVLYFKTPHDGATYSYWVALNRYTL